MADFQFSLINFEVEGVQVIAGSADPIDKARKLAEDLRITYPIAFGLDFKGISGVLGTFYEAERKFVNPANILVRPDRTIGVITYSSGPIGRFTAQEVLRVVRFWKNQSKR